MDEEGKCALAEALGQSLADKEHHSGAAATRVLVENGADIRAVIDGNTKNTVLHLAADGDRGYGFEECKIRVDMDGIKQKELETNK